MRIISEKVLNLPGYWIVNIDNRSGQRYELVYRRKIVCPHCKSDKLSVKEKKLRVIRHENTADRATFLDIHTAKYYCRCCHKYFWQQLPAIMPYNRKTEAFRKQVAFQAMRGVTKKDLSTDYEIGEATVYRYFIKELHLLSHEIQSYECPKVLGIDEHFFTKKQGFATTLCDITKHRIFDVLPGRSEKALERYFQRLKHKERCRVVVMDLSEPYRHLIRRFFPNAKIVSDRFHVIRVVNQHFMALWKQLDPVGKRNRGLLKLMRRHESRLTDEQKQRLRRYLNSIPALAAAYDFKQELAVLLLNKKRKRKECKELIPKFIKSINQLKKSCFESMVTLGNTLESWQEEVVRMWRFTWSNGMTEGFHNKMKMLVRRAYGFRNFENYRLWVKILCR